ncbi:MAG TPA: hypothetical protein VFJ28_02480 [Marmoricola sp.]|nr:hypothetical protein [Marmoricola sp.]
MTENSIRPKLVLPDAAAALDFYRDLLGGRERARYTHGSSVVFAKIEVFGTVLTLKDADVHDPVTHPGPLLDVPTRSSAPSPTTVARSSSPWPTSSTAPEVGAPATPSGCSGWCRRRWRSAPRRCSATWIRRRQTRA